MPRLRDLAYPVVYLLGLALLFGAAYLYLAGTAGAPRIRLAGAATPPAVSTAAPRDDGAADRPTAPAADRPAAIASGPRVDLERDRFTAGTPDTLRLRVLDTDGTALAGDRGVRRVLRLAVVRRDLKDFRSLHAVPGADGTWSAPITLPSAGPYRLLAELRTGGGEAVTMSADLLAPGAYRAATVPPPGVEANAWPYSVTMTGSARAGENSRLSFTVHRDGVPTADLTSSPEEPTEATALRFGDLTPARIVLPTQVDSGDRPSFEVDLACIRAGTYRLFLSFRVAHELHTAEFTLPVAA